MFSYLKWQLQRKQRKKLQQKNLQLKRKQQLQQIKRLQQPKKTTTKKTSAKKKTSSRSEAAKKTGIETSIPEAAKNVIVDTNKQIIKAKSVQNQIIQATTSAIQENIKKWNDSTSAFTDLNRNILQSWISTFTQPRN